MENPHYLIKIGFDIVDITQFGYPDLERGAEVLMDLTMECSSLVYLCFLHLTGQVTSLM